LEMVRLPRSPDQKGHQGYYHHT
ncbi:hypothetical protein HMPREF1018_03453, partial [Bacteroides fragilis]